MKKILTILFAGILPLSALHAGTKSLSLVVEGSIEAPPEWRNDRNAVINQLNLSFAGMVASSDPNADVDSQASSAKLITSNYPASVAIARPQGCSIGTSKVENGNVLLVMNGQAIRSNGNISIPSSGLQVFQLRFAAAGKHGTQSGVVACSNAGSLVYTY